MLFENVTLVLPDRLLPDAVLRAVNGQIHQTLARQDPLAKAEPGEEIIDGRGGYLAPGFIDLHVHGARGRNAMEANPEAFAEILQHHAGGGTTSLTLTSIVAPLEGTLRLLAAARTWNAENREPSVRLLGIHLEGPFFSPGRAGAHDPAQIRVPAAAEIEALLAYADVISQMTLAPEVPGALELIARLRAHGIIASGGHSDAWDEDAQAALDAGMSQVTHVFNAMSGARKRGPGRVAGLLEVALSEPRLRCELIADGHHVAPTLLRLVYRAKGAGGVTLVTDASPGAGLAEGAAYRFGNVDCIVRGGVGLTADGAALAGSTSTMIQGVANLVRQARVPLVDAVRMATWNPAVVLGVEKLLGLLIQGNAADLVLLSSELEVMATYVSGECVFRA
jgi:N-acetylglucosamine-6-phosphate deacetylase